MHDGDANKLRKVYVALTEEEANQLIGYLKELLETRKTGAHWHLSEEMLVFEREGLIVNELTIYRADDESAVF